MLTLWQNLRFDGLALFPLVFVSRGDSLLSKGFATRTLSEFGREPLLLVLNFQLNVGHPLPVKRHIVTSRSPS